MTALANCSSPLERVRLRRKIRDLRKAIATSTSTAEPVAAAGTSEAQYDPASPTPTVTLASPTLEEAELDLMEIRRVVYRDTPPVHDSDDELIVSTADWDQL